ncbi:MAG: ABC transporter substrate-binding protein [Acutalibacteraceae bacterium]
MNAFLRIAAVFLCLAAVMSGCKKADGTDNSTASAESGSSAETSESTADYDKTFRMAYTGMDTLNPYLSKSKQNKELSTLLYDSLFTVDSSYNLIYRLGTSVEIYEKYCVVYIKSGVMFSDGNLLTAYDVAASFEAARKSSTAGYSDDLANIMSCTVMSENAVAFQLYNHDVNIAYCLTFPVFRDQTQNEKDSSGVYKPPVGSGRYIYYNENGDAYLYANPNWSFGTVRTEKIYLCNLPDDEAVKYCLESGKVNCYYDDLSDEALEAANSSDGVYVPLNNMVFIGANGAREISGNADFRKFVSSAIDRESIANGEYLGRATAAKGLYNSSFSLLSEKMKLNTSTAKNNAQQFLNAVTSGFEKDGEGYFTLGGERIEITVLVNSENSCRVLLAQSVASAINSFGIHCTVNSVSRSDYNSALSAGNYDLYIGEMKIGADLSLTKLLGVYGIKADCATLSSFKKYREGSITFTEFTDNFEEELPIIPVCFRNGVMLLPKGLSGEMNPSYTDVYFNIHNCSFTS